MFFFLVLHFTYKFVTFSHKLVILLMHSVSVFLLKLGSPKSNEPTYLRSSLLKHQMLSQARYTAISRKVVGKNVHATILKGNMGCWSIHCSWHTELSNLLLLLSFTTRKQTSKTSGAILSYFFEEEWAQNHPQSLSGLSPVLFPTTYLEIAVCILSKIQLMVYYQFWVLIGGATTRLYIIAH